MHPLRRYILCTAVRDQSAQDYYDYVKGLYQAPSTVPDSKAALGIKLYVNADTGAVIVRCKRADKTITQEEIANLAIEYKLETDKLTVLLDSRAFKITNNAGEIQNAKPKRSNKRGSSKKASLAKRDAHLDDNKRQAACADQLQLTGAATNMHEESLLQPGQEAKA